MDRTRQDEETSDPDSASTASHQQGPDFPLNQDPIGEARVLQDPMQTAIAENRQAEGRFPHWAELADAPPTGDGKRYSSFWMLGTILLVVIALSQLTWFSRERLAQVPQLRPLLLQWCLPLGCNLPPWREPEGFQVLSRSVEPHPDGIEALRIKLAFSNQARFPQPYPHLQLELFDRDENLAARRSFYPEQYLGNNSGPKSMMEPGQTAAVDLYLKDPGNDIVGFRFDFL